MRRHDERDRRLRRAERLLYECAVDALAKTAVLLRLIADADGSVDATAAAGDASDECVQLLEAMRYAEHVSAKLHQRRDHAAPAPHIH